MKIRYVSSFVYAILATTLYGCSSVEVWPFGEESTEQSTAPKNSVEYQCAEGKKFYTRTIEKGNAIWLILSDREVALSKVEGDSERYSNGVSTLTIKDGVARLEESPTSLYADCKIPVPQKKKD
ncbi:MAG TPA: hypothetical protein VEA39_07655 [Methylophilaceae bacterium]|nr:hypothetical protein [Methylophilaceae bacterium]